MRQLLQLPCVALLGLMAFLAFERHPHAFAAGAGRGGPSVSGGEGNGPSSPLASTGPTGSAPSSAPLASSTPAAAAAPSGSGASSGPAASGWAGRPPPVIGSSSATASFPPKSPSGDESALDKFRDYVFGRGRPADAKRSELQRQQNLAREALSRGQIQPLDDIARNVENSVPGELLSARLEKDAAGSWIYRLVILSDDGHYHDVVVDAGRNAILKKK